MYRQMGYSDLIAHDANDYVRLALGLGSDPQERSLASDAILASCDTLYDDRSIVHELEDLWEQCACEN
jgi:predicted O-linked N-acetylglucosamine transferase (SPINDLY family)